MMEVEERLAQIRESWHTLSRQGESDPEVGFLLLYIDRLQRHESLLRNAFVDDLMTLRGEVGSRVNELAERVSHTVATPSEGEPG